MPSAKKVLVPRCSAWERTIGMERMEIDPVTPEASRFMTIAAEKVHQLLRIPGGSCDIL